MLAGLALLSSLMWGTADFLGGKLSKRFAPIAVTGVSQIFGLLTGLVLLLVTKGWLHPTLSFNGYFVNGVIAGITGFIGIVSYYAGLSTGKMGVIAPITSLSAVIPLIYGLAKGEAPSTLQFAGMVVALTGCFMASGPEAKNGVSAKPLFLGILTAVMFGITMVFMARGSRTGSLLTMTSMRVTTVLVVLVIGVVVGSGGGFARSDIPMLITIGAADFLANVTLGIATTKGLISVALVLGSLFPVVTTILAYKYLCERMQRIQYVGAILAVAGVALISIG